MDPTKPCHTQATIDPLVVTVAKDATRRQVGRQDLATAVQAKGVLAKGTCRLTPSSRRRTCRPDPAYRAYEELRARQAIALGEDVARATSSRPPSWSPCPSRQDEARASPSSWTTRAWMLSPRTSPSRASWTSPSSWTSSPWASLATTVDVARQATMGEAIATSRAATTTNGPLASTIVAATDVATGLEGASPRLVGAY